MEKLWMKFRAKRNQYLEQTDKCMLSDFPLPTPLRIKYREYRQYLRNLPALYNDATITTAKIKTFEEWAEFRKNGEY